jgi:hypothetical protein
MYKYIQKLNYSIFLYNKKNIIITRILLFYTYYIIIKMLIILVLLIVFVLYINSNKCENFNKYENFDNNNIHDKYYKCTGRYSMLIGNCQ